MDKESTLSEAMIVLKDKKKTYGAHMKKGPDFADRMALASDSGEARGLLGGIARRACLLRAEQSPFLLFRMLSSSRASTQLLVQVGRRHERHHARGSGQQDD
jgi:hypothetical protein